MNKDERDESFLARWSRRKQAPAEMRAREDVRMEPESAASGPPEAAAPAAPPPDLPPIESLTADSDFSRFMRPDVAPASRNAAVKKLFADPHFNVMDGLDTYIDDYTKPDPIPLSMLKELAQSKMLGLFDEAKEEESITVATGDDLADAPIRDDAQAPALEVALPDAPLPDAQQLDASQLDAAMIAAREDAQHRSAAAAHAPPGVDEDGGVRPPAARATPSGD